MLSKTTRMARLFDFYGQLLTDRQQLMIELYYHHDLSLGEIAEQVHVSRQAVHDNLRRGEKLLEEYETKLRLLERYQQAMEKIKQLEVILDRCELAEGKQTLQALKDLLIL
ncbi:MAG: YlxM family DNA-binding protein [Thermoanaerobacteraceae bacterium]|nr:YlxM family DNA-binding protein [Thermoanaerobacteraceae bacterium]